MNRETEKAEEAMLGAKNDWRKREVFLRLTYCGVLTKRETHAAVWAELSPVAICRHCDEYVPPEEAEVLAGYWFAMWFIVHRGCRPAGKRVEAYECQKIDADCNDCGHFQRRVAEQGFCGKLQKEMTARPGFASLYPCFVHRLDLPVKGREAGE